MSAHGKPEFHRVDGWQDLPNRLRDAYRRIQADLYSHQDGLIQ